MKKYKYLVIIGVLVLIFTMLFTIGCNNNEKTIVDYKSEQIANLFEALKGTKYGAKIYIDKEKMSITIWIDNGVNPKDYSDSFSYDFGIKAEAR
jgi:hypothetical protein